MKPFGSVHAALAFAWRMEVASVKPGALTGFLKNPMSQQAGSDMSRVEMAGQAALIRREAAHRLADECYAYCVAKYSTRQRHQIAALALYTAHMHRALSADRPWITALVHAAIIGREDRDASQASIGAAHGIAQSTVSKWSKRVGGQIRRTRYEIENSLHGHFAKQELICE